MVCYGVERVKGPGVCLVNSFVVVRNGPFSERNEKEWEPLSL